MYRFERHPLVLFSLVPKNDRSENVLAHPSNSHLVSRLPNNKLALDIGFHIRSESCNTLATLGRGDADIFVEGASIAKIQCSFEINVETNVVMLYDRSHAETTQVFGENVTPFEHGRIRKVVVQDELNTIIGMGGERQNLVQFGLRWHQGAMETMEKIKNRESIRSGQAENPRRARTIDDLPTLLPSQRETRGHTPGLMQQKLRYREIGAALGSGQFGTVHKCIDVDSGTLMAVKVLVPSPGASDPEEWNQSLHYALEREVETLSEISHVSVVLNLLSAPNDSTNVYASHASLTIFHHKAGTDRESRYLWV
jgi:hypothetical protein